MRGREHAIPDAEAPPGVIAESAKVTEGQKYTTRDVPKRLLDVDFTAGLTLCRLFIDMSKDEFEAQFRRARGGRQTGIKAYRADSEGFVATLGDLGLLRSMQSVVNTPVSWRDVLVERLKKGRGSAVEDRKGAGDLRTSQKRSSKRSSDPGDTRRGVVSKAKGGIRAFRRIL